MEDTPVGIDICVERVPGAFSLNTIEEEALRLRRRRRRYTEDLRRALLPLARVPACQCRPWRWNIVPVRHSSPLPWHDYDETRGACRLRARMRRSGVRAKAPVPCRARQSTRRPTRTIRRPR
jgi:hypothetical protein